MKLQKKIEQNFTTVHNGFIRDTDLGIAEKGLLLYMLHLPDNWNFSILGLAATLNEGRCKIANTLSKLERAGYLRRTRVFDENTRRIVDWIYEFSDEKQLDWISDSHTDDDNGKDGIVKNDEKKKKVTTTDSVKNECSVKESPDAGFLHMANQDIENQTQINTKEINTIVINNQSIESGETIDEIDYTETIQEISEQIGREVLIKDRGYTETQVDGIIGIIADTVCSGKHYQRVGGENVSTQLLRRKFSELYYEHIDYVLQSIQRTNTRIKNFKAYILTSLYNSLNTFDEYITQLSC